MGDFKSKMPDMNEVMSMMDKFYNGVKNSVVGIINDYKLKHNQPETPASVAPVNTKPQDTTATKDTTAIKEETVVVKKPAAKVKKAATTTKKSAEVKKK